MENENVAEVEKKIKRLNYLKQKKLQLDTSDKPKKKGLLKNVLLLLLAILCCVNLLGQVYMQSQYSRLKRDITILEEDLQSAASTVRSMQEDKSGDQ